MSPNLDRELGPGCKRDVRLPWLRSYYAIKSHMVFLQAIGLLGYCVLTGNQEPPMLWKH
jgi:hypothetical protein